MNDTVSTQNGKWTPAKTRRGVTSAGFTLVELLTVIAIVALLAALLLGSLWTAKRRAQSTVCKNNVRQLGILLSSYVQDHHEYPLYLNYDTTKYPLHEPVWLRSLGAVEGLDPKGIGANPSYTSCPSAKKPNDAPPRLGYLGYGYNVSGIVGAAGQEGLGLGGKGGEDPRNAFAPPVKEGDVTAPSDMIAVGDSIQASPSGLLSDGDAQIGIFYWVTERIAGSNKRSLARHAGGGNFVFCDVHVPEIELERLFVNVDEEHARLWNRDNKSHLERSGAN